MSVQQKKRYSQIWLYRRSGLPFPDTITTNVFFKTPVDETDSSASPNQAHNNFNIQANFSTPSSVAGVRGLFFQSILWQTLGGVIWSVEAFEPSDAGGRPGLWWSERMQVDTSTGNYVALFTDNFETRLHNLLLVDKLTNSIVRQSRNANAFQNIDFPIHPTVMKLDITGSADGSLAAFKQGNFDVEVSFNSVLDLDWVGMEIGPHGPPEIPNNPGIPTTQESSNLALTIEQVTGAGAKWTAEPQ